MAWINSVDHVVSWIAHDLEKHEQCKVDDMLTYFLERCLVDPKAVLKDTNSSVLQPYLKAVLPICNTGEIKTQLDA